MFLLPIVPAPIPAIVETVPHNSKKDSEAPERGCADCKREVRKSEQIWRRHKVYVPRLVEVQVADTGRTGKAWI